ncbi:ABC transporter ATP-binding protein [Paramaledivibacter caminithermalis]|jgi:ATP-binding cassette subfamily B protein|uniref:ATP-binding cassette, subfamily B n=1 Tax=Paramaledivibacter caminithermalis (strain DSM 15212 / CIP 107654 / DViRD3) TaxID=1121301 RepID=A0A1M6T228_PARC5|nr:ABC transporter ATP-binding protein [Paramaledivibacter caminithermalis]SHK51043.1 ATP-binding cassette, subfamily B [Paramaledivibacter caminithermalis DSM 15212]
MENNNYKFFLNLIPFFKKFKLTILLIELLLILQVILNVLQPLLWAKVLVLLFNKKSDILIYYIIGIIGIYVVLSICEVIEKYLKEKAALEITYKIKTYLYRTIIHMEYKDFLNFEKGKLQQILETDAPSIASSTLNYFFQTSLNIIQIAILTIIMIKMNLILGIIILFFTPFIAFINIKYGYRIKEQGKKILNTRDKYINFIHQILYGLKSIKVLGLRKTFLEIYKEKAINVKNKQLKFSKIEITAYFVKNTLSFIMSIIVLVVGCIMILRDRLLYEYYIAFTTYSDRFALAYSNLLNQNISIKQLLNSIERINNLVENYKIEDERFGKCKCKNTVGDIEFHNVTFMYDKKPVLNNISFKINVGSILTIVGHNGCGKSTLVNLILRLYKCTKGRITLDGVDISEYDYSSYIKNISVINQSPFMFDMDIYDNITLKNKQYTYEQVVKITKELGIHDFIVSLENGYKTKIMQNGVNLSGGQVQKLMLARLILKKSRIMILDEPTNFLDGDSINRFINIINRFINNNLIILITHNPKLIREINNVLYLSEGKIICQGKHDEIYDKYLTYKIFYDKLKNDKCSNKNVS